MFDEDRKNLGESGSRNQCSDRLSFTPGSQAWSQSGGLGDGHRERLDWTERAGGSVLVADMKDSATPLGGLRRSKGNIMPRAALKRPSRGVASSSLDH